MYDVVILTDKRYVNPTEKNDYINNVLLEDRLINEACKALGLNTHRTNWDDPNFDWETTKSILFRTTWDYFDRFTEFSSWLDKVSKQTRLLNSEEIIRWNIDKHYLTDLHENGINVVDTLFIENGDNRELKEVIKESGFSNCVLKPVVSGAGRHTYKLNQGNIAEYEQTYSSLIVEEAMMLQPFINSITEKGEVSFMVFGGKFSHAVLKKAKSGDFRVQDDFGGSVHDYYPNATEIAFAEDVISNCPYDPIYARVDVVWDNDDNMAVAELELIEPELWFRNSKDAAMLLAKAIKKILK